MKLLVDKRREFTRRDFAQWLLLILLFLMITSRNNFAEIKPAADGEFILSGKVFDQESGASLTGALVFIPSLEIGDETDKDGKFELTISQSGDYLLKCQFLGYEDINRTVNVTEATIDITLYMKLRPVEMSGVEIVKERDKRMESPQSLTVIDENELLATRGQTLGETLKDVPGITVLQTGPSIAKPVIRGLHSDRIVILNAGVPQEGQQWGGEHAPEIDPFAPEKIEVLRGAAGVQYGSNAIGGVIRVEPRELGRIPGIGGKVSMNAFANNRQGSGSLLLEGGSSLIRGLGWRAQGSFRKAGDSQTPDFNMTNTGFEEQNWSGGIGYNLENYGVDINYSHFGTELGLYRGAHISNLTALENAIERGQPLTLTKFTYTVNPPKQLVDHNLLSVFGHYDLPATGRFEIQYGWQQNHRREFDAHKPFSSEPPTEPAFDMVLTTYSLDANFKHNPIGNVYGKIGFSGMRQGNARRSSGFLIPNFRAYSFGAYWIENWTKGNLTINGGTRFDYRWMKVFPESTKDITERIHEYNNFSGVVGMVYRFYPGWSLGANLGSAWRPPNVSELYSDGVHHGTAQYEKGDTELKTEKALELDATLRYDGVKSYLEFSVFNNAMDDFIYLFPEPGGILTIRGAFPAFSYRQANAVIRGFDGHFDYQLTPYYGIGVSASVLRGDNRETDEPLIYMPADRFKFFNHFHLPLEGVLDNALMELSTTLVRKQTRVPDGELAAPPSGYVLFDLDFSGEINVGSVPVNMSVSVQNLLDTSYRDYLSRYRFFIDDPGRNIILRLNIPFGSVL